MWQPRHRMRVTTVPPNEAQVPSSPARAVQSVSQVSPANWGWSIWKPELVANSSRRSGSTFEKSDNRIRRRRPDVGPWPPNALPRDKRPCTTAFMWQVHPKLRRRLNGRGTDSPSEKGWRTFGKCSKTVGRAESWAMVLVGGAGCVLGAWGAVVLAVAEGATGWWQAMAATGRRRVGDKEVLLGRCSGLGCRIDTAFGLTRTGSTSWIMVERRAALQIGSEASGKNV